MAERIIKTIIQFRRDSQANLESVADTLVLRAGEPCVTLDGADKGKIKIGDGVTTWGQLPYLSGDTTVQVVADEKSIHNTDGIIALMGYNTATEGQQAKKGADGLLEWFTPSVSDAQLAQMQTNVASVMDIINGTEETPGVLTRLGNVENSVTTLTQNLQNNYDTSDEVDEKISQAVSSVYHAGGNVADVKDIVVDAAHAGYVYNVTTNFTTDNTFIEGAGKEYPAGTNVAVVEIPGDPITYKLDVLGSFVDLSNTVEFKVQGTNGTAVIQNEPTGGGSKFWHTDGSEAFIGVNDGGKNGMMGQIYADIKDENDNWIGSRVNIYQKGIFYHNAEDKAGADYVADDPKHEIAVKGDIPAYITHGLTNLPEGSASANILAAIGSYEDLLAAIQADKVVVDRTTYSGTDEKTQVAIYTYGTDIASNLIFYYGDNYKVFQIQNVDGTLALGVTEVQLAREGEIPDVSELESKVAELETNVTAVTATANGNKTVIDSLPDQILTDIVNVARTATTNTAEIRIFTKQEDGTYSPDVQHGVITLIGAGQGPDGVNGAGLMTAADKTKLDGIDTSKLVTTDDTVILDGGNASENIN